MNPSKQITRQHDILRTLTARRYGATLEELSGGIWTRLPTLPSPYILGCVPPILLGFLQVPGVDDRPSSRDI